MNTHHARSCVEPLIVFLLISFARVAASEPAELPKTALTIRATLSKQIDALASRNTAPRIVPSKPHREPVYPTNFDSDEQDRVHQVFCELNDNGSEELWEELCQHLGDSRYSLTLSYNGGDTWNYTVGEVCGLMVRARLFGVYEAHLDTNDFGSQIHIDVEIDDLFAWRTQNGAKALYELQIAACEMALEKVPRLHFTSHDKIAQIQERIESQIATLRKTRKAVQSPLSLDAFRFYSGN